MKKNKLMAILAVIVLVAVGYYAYLIFQRNDIANYNDDNKIQNKNTDDNKANGDDPKLSGRTSTYSSNEYDFSIQYPYDWNTEFAPEDEISPKFNVYLKPAGTPVEAPFDHFANITNVSVFPEGIPTEGLMSQSREVNKDEFVNLNLSSNSRVYTLEDGSPYAAYLQFVDRPNSWNDSGYLWIRQQVENLNVTCVDSQNNEIGPYDCDPMAKDHVIKRTGSVNEELWKNQKAIANTLKFK